MLFEIYVIGRTFYKNVEVKINQNLKNVLRVFLKMSVDLERFYFANLYIN